METTKKYTQFFEIKLSNDTCGLCGRFKNEEQALKEINDSYVRAKEQGYDNRHEKWSIVCVQTCKEFDERGEFLKEETTRFVVARASYDDYEKEYMLDR